ncbi:MAG TPA: ABC transporter permease [Rhodanobacteraceae bacterium]|nr:ABC transporter permease [Rhodanobacteraceae bacterium]
MKEPKRIPYVPGKPEKEVDSELRFHLEERIQANIAAGMNADDARRAAMERFGDVDGVRDECARLLAEERLTRRRRDWFDDLRQDLRFAIRSTAGAPMFTLLAVLTLALGIGANAAMFGVVKSVLFNSLPYADAGRLTRVYTPIRALGDREGAISAGSISDLRERQHSFSSFGAWLPTRESIYNPGDNPQIVKVRWVEPALFTTLGVRFIKGTNFREEDGLRDTAFVTVIPWKTWQTVFAGAEDVVGKTVRLNNINRTVVGVLPHDFVMPEGDEDYFYPIAIAPFMTDPISVRGSHNFDMVGRLKPGVSQEAADRELRTIGDELERLYAKDNLGIGMLGVPLRDSIVGDTRTPLVVLLASAALVLLITCANLAGALLSRTISRRKEFAVRVALGAGRGRLVRQLLTESIMLAVAGGIAGVFLAIILLGMLRGMSLEAIPRYADLTLDTTALIVTFIVALLTGLAFGLGPALSVGRADPQGTLRDETRGTTETTRTRQMRGVLVAGQIALCLSLLAAAGLLGRSLWAMTHAPLGFNGERMLTFTVQLPTARYRGPAERANFHAQFAERLQALPGVQGVALTSGLPTNITNRNGLFVEHRPWGPNEPVPFMTTSRVSDSYFDVFEIPVRQGRTFSTADLPDVPPVAVINEEMARRYWPDGNAVGSRFRWGPPNPDQPWTTIIGVVGNMRNSPTALGPEPMMFFPLRQVPFGENVAIKTTGNPSEITNSVRTVLRAIDPGLPMYQISTMQKVIDRGYAARRLPVLLMMGFGVLALLVASVGIYAMFATMATAREREFGVRMALGSSRGAVAGLVIRQGGVWMALGLLLGSAGVFAATRLVRSQLFGVPEFDPLTIGAAVLALAICAGAALLVPVRKATRVDPITVLR